MVEVGVNFSIERMIKIYGTVRGFDMTGMEIGIRLLSWTSISTQRVTYSTDGYYVLHLPKELGYTITYIQPGYTNQTFLIITDDKAELDVLLEQSGEPFP